MAWGSSKKPSTPSGTGLRPRPAPAAAAYPAAELGSDHCRGSSSDERLPQEPVRAVTYAETVIAGAKTHLGDVRDSA